MPANGIRQHAAVLLGYLCVALAYAWPLPMQFGTALLGPVSSDLGVYVWNIWVFRHEIVAHGNFPFLTSEILPLTPPVPLTLHNYTTAANLVAFPLQPWLGVAATFNLLTLASGVLAAYAMFLMIRRATGDAAAGWLAGLAFGFSPFMSARAMEHFSLIQAAPLPLFVLLFDKLRAKPSFGIAAATGACVAWAFLSDPYYAVYCLLIAGTMLGCAAFDIRLSRVATPVGLRLALTLVLVCLGGLIVGVILRGGGRFEVLGLRVSITRLYTPVLVFVVLLFVRVVMSVRPRVTWLPSMPPMRAVVMLGATCALLLAPVLTPMVLAYRESQWISPPVLWRSSAPGLDLFSLFVPNPMHPWVRPLVEEGLRLSPGGFVENVAAIPWTLVALVAAGMTLAWRRMPRFWILFTGLFILLALGPFIRIGGVLTYLPTPWTLLRYVPVIGAARMPQRFSILVMLGVAALAAYALHALRPRLKRPALFTAAVSGLLLLEMMPAPRTMHTAAVPSVFRRIADDPREVRVLNLPFGLRDGLSSHGNTSAAAQYYQTVHQKPILGGYLSRLPQRDVDDYDRRRVTGALMRLSARREVSPERQADAIARARESVRELNVGYVVADTSRCPPELLAFAIEAFGLVHVTTDGDFALYRSTLLD